VSTIVERTADVVSRVSTESVDPADRIGFWEEYNRHALVGLTCSSYADQGLVARQTNLRAADLRLADIAGNEHVIERTPRTCRAFPKDSIFASLLLEGDAAFFHSGGCLTLGAGDLVLYDTTRPYLFGFSTSMRQLLVDVPRELFAERCLPGGVPTPMVLGTGSAREAAIGSALRSVLLGLVGEDAAETQDTVLDLIRFLAWARVGEGPPSLAGLSHLIVAKGYIDRNVHDPGLSTARVARVLDVSVRHLSRIFEPEGSTPSRYILERRLAGARAQLSDRGSRGMTIADVAYHWGFSSQAHFARVFRRHFRQTPSEARGDRAVRS
jgi:AraC-like DNA-binding protein